MENQKNESKSALEDFSLMCDCAEKVASFGINADFLKKAVTDYYQAQSKGEKLSQEELNIIKDKYKKFQLIFDEFGI